MIQWNVYEALTRQSQKLSNLLLISSRIHTPRHSSFYTLLTPEIELNSRLGPTHSPLSLCTRTRHSTQWNLSPITNSRNINHCQMICYTLLYLFICWWRPWESNANELNAAAVFAGIFGCVFLCFSPFSVSLFPSCYFLQLNFICKNAKIQRRQVANEEAPAST